MTNDVAFQYNMHGRNNKTFSNSILFDILYGKLRFLSFVHNCSLKVLQSCWSFYSKIIFKIKSLRQQAVAMIFLAAFLCFKTMLHQTRGPKASLDYCFFVKISIGERLMHSMQ